jgi:hypothetical protein
VSGIEFRSHPIENKSRRKETNTMEELMSDREQMAWLNRAHLSDDDDVPSDPRDWNVDD